MPRLHAAVVSALLLSAACASSGAPASTDERILAVDASGKVIRQSTADERTRVSFGAPVSTVWRALVASYAEAGIEPTVSDPVAGRYGNGASIVPRRMMDKPIG